MREVLPQGHDDSYRAIAELDQARIVSKLAQCGVSIDDASEVAHALGDFRGNRELVDALASIDTWLAENLGSITPDFPIWDDLFDHGPAGRFFYLYAAALGIERVERYFDEIGLDEEIAKSTFSIVAKHIAIYERKWHELGTDAGWWLLLMLRGVLIQCGSLQYHRIQLGISNLAPSPWIGEEERKEKSAPFQLGSEAFGLHIPQGTDLAPVAIEKSLALAEKIFDVIWPSPLERLFTLQSWLLDPQLGTFLDPSSNIMQFQGRFELLDGAPEDDADILEFVFRSPGTPRSELPRTTSLERGVLELLDAGGHWHATAGWLKKDHVRK